METLMASSSPASTSAITCRSPIRPHTSFSSTSSCLLGTTQINRNPSFRIQFRPSLHLPRSSSSSSSVKVGTVCGIAEINENQFSDVVLKSTRPVLVEFVAGWCGPCRLISPLIESIAQEYKEKLVVVKIDHDSNPKLIEEYKVYGLPALILFKDGQEIPGSRREGAITKAKLKAYVDALLESVSVA